MHNLVGAITTTQVKQTNSVGLSDNHILRHGTWKGTNMRYMQIYTPIAC